VYRQCSCTINYRPELHVTRDDEDDGGDEDDFWTLDSDGDKMMITYAECTEWLVMRWQRRILAGWQRSSLQEFNQDKLNMEVNALRPTTQLIRYGMLD
jgi:hypothetical protein